jgi:hypothetical protein
MAIGKRTNTKQHFEDFLNENLSNTLSEQEAIDKYIYMSSKKSENVIIKNHEQRTLGSFLRKNDKTQFNVMYNEFCNQHNDINKR